MDIPIEQISTSSTEATEITHAAPDEKVQDQYQAIDLSREEQVRYQNILKTTPPAVYDNDQKEFVLHLPPNPPSTFDEFYQRPYNQSGNSEGFEVINLPSIENAAVIKMTDGPQLIFLENDLQIHQELSLALNVIRELDKLFSQDLQVDGHLDQFSIIFNPHASLTDSQQIPDEKTIIIGSRGLDLKNPFDFIRVLSHECGHAKIQQFLMDRFNFRIGAITKDHILEPSLTFFNEGAAEYASLTIAGKNPRHELIKQSGQMYPPAQTDLLKGKLQGEYDSEEVNNWLINEHKQNLHAQIHTRLLPAALIEYWCRARHRTFEDVVGNVVNSFQTTAEYFIARTHRIHRTQVSLDINTTLRNIRAADETPQTANIETLYEQSRLQPIEIMSWPSTDEESLQTYSDKLQAWMSSGNAI